MHQFSNVRIITILAIDIQNMSSIFKRQSQRQVHIPNDIYRFSGLIVIFFRDKNDIGIRQFSVILILVQIFYIHHTGMISCPVRVSSIVRALNLDIIFLARAVGGICIQTN